MMMMITNPKPLDGGDGNADLQAGCHDVDVDVGVVVVVVVFGDDDDDIDEVDDQPLRWRQVQQQGQSLLGCLQSPEP